MMGGGQSGAGSVAPRGQWTSGIFGCASDWSTCLYGCLLLPCLFGDVAQRVQGDSRCDHCLQYSLLGLVCLCARECGAGRTGWGGAGRAR